MKIRINDLARELEVKSKQILDVLIKVGVTEKKTHSSSVEEDEAEKVRKYFHENSGAPTRHRTGGEEFRPKIDLSKISKPGDALKAILARKEPADGAGRDRRRGPATTAPPKAIVNKPAAPRAGGACRCPARTALRYATVGSLALSAPPPRLKCPSLTALPRPRRSSASEVAPEAVAPAVTPEVPVALPLPAAAVPPISRIGCARKSCRSTASAAAAERRLRPSRSRGAMPPHRQTAGHKPPQTARAAAAPGTARTAGAPHDRSADRTASGLHCSTTATASSSAACIGVGESQRFAGTRTADFSASSSRTARRARHWRTGSSRCAATVPCRRAPADASHAQRSGPGRTSADGWRPARHGNTPWRSTASRRFAGCGRSTASGHGSASRRTHRRASPRALASVIRGREASRKAQ